MSAKYGQQKDGNMNNLFREIANSQPTVINQQMPHHGSHNPHMPHVGGGPQQQQQQQQYHSYHHYQGNNAYQGGGNMYNPYGGGSGVSGPGQKIPPQMGPAYNNSVPYKQYRDNSRPKSPPKSSLPPGSGKDFLEELDNDQDQAAGGYKDDRIQNELLKEICSDIGIDDAMDLDIFDFDAPPDSFYFPHTQNRLSDFGSMDQPAPYGDMPPQDHYPRKPGFEDTGGQHQQHYLPTSQQKGSSDTYHPNKVPSSSSGPVQKGQEPAEYSPYTQSVPSVKSLDQTQDAAVDSPTVSSSVPGSNDSHQQQSAQSRPASMSSSLGSPSVHSTTPSLTGPLDSLKPPSSVESLKPPGSVESYSAASPAGSSGLPHSLHRMNHGRQDSVDSSASCPSLSAQRAGSTGSPMSTTNLSSSMENLVGSPGDADKTIVDLTSSEDQYTSSFKSDVFTCYSQPSSPAKAKISAQMNNSSIYKAQSMNDNLHRHAIHRLQSQNDGRSEYESHTLTDDEKHAKNNAYANGFKVPQGPAPATIKTERSSSVSGSSVPDQGYSSTASTLSEGHYGSSSNLCNNVSSSTAIVDSKDNVRAYLNQKSEQGEESSFEVLSMPTTADLNIPTLHSDTPSASSSKSNSPTSMHVAKRARVINSGSDLLNEMRERYSFTKGADMYAAPPQYPPIPVQRVRPTPQLQGGYNTSGMNPNRVSMSTEVPSQFNFGGVKPEGGYPAQRFMGPGGPSNNYNMNNSNTQGMGQPPPLQRRPMYGNTNMGGQMQGGNMDNSGMPGMYNNDVVNNASQYGHPQSAMDMSLNQGSQVGMNNMGNSNMQNNSMGHNSGMNGMGQSNNMQSQQMNVNTAGNMSMNTGSADLNNMQMNRGQGNIRLGAPVAGTRMSSSVNSGQTPMGPSSHMGGVNSAQGMTQMPYQNQNYSAGHNVVQNQPPLSPSGSNVNSKMYSQNMDNNNINSNQHRPYDSSNNYGQSNSQYLGNQSQYGTSQRSTMGYQDQYSGSGHQQSQGGAPNYRSQSPGMPGYSQMANQMNNPGMNSQMGGPNNMAGGPYGQNMNMQMRGGGSYGSNMNSSVSGMASQPMGPMDPTMGPMPAVQDIDTATGMVKPTPGRLRPPPEGLMQQIISDRSSAFRSHPLFPLLRDLIIADMNFHTPSFPFQLIANLPGDFDKLLQNYLNRNPPARNMPQTNPAIEQVIMDALKYAHQSLIDKIQVKKTEVGYQETPKPLSAIEDFCERFDRAVKNSMSTPKPTGSSVNNKAVPKTPTKSTQSAAPTTPKKEGKDIKTEEKTGGTTPTGKGGTAGRNKVLPKEAVALMLDWLREHQDNPYPNDDEKEMLISKTKLTINQINYWFTNARRRILPKWALQRYMEQQQHSPYGPRLTPM